MAQLGANPAIAVSLELVADRPRTAPRCCILGVAHHQLSGYVTFPIPEKGLLIHIILNRHHLIDPIRPTCERRPAMALPGPDLHRLIAPALPGAFLHSITSSAVARSVCGTSRPSAF